MEQEIKKTVQEEIQVFFLELALCLGGAILTHHPPNDFVWGLSRSFGRIFREQMARFEQNLAQTPAKPDNEAQNHPAIEELLELIRSSFIATSEL